MREGEGGGGIVVVKGQSMDINIKQKRKNIRGK